MINSEILDESTLENMKSDYINRTFKNLSPELIEQYAKDYINLELSQFHITDPDFDESDIILSINDSPYKEEIFKDYLTKDEITEIQEITGPDPLDINIEDLDYFTQSIRDQFGIIDHQTLNDNDHGNLLIRLYFQSEEMKQKYIKDHDMD